MGLIQAPDLVLLGYLGFVTWTAARLDSQTSRWWQVGLGLSAALTALAPDAVTLLSAWSVHLWLWWQLSQNHAPPFLETEEQPSPPHNSPFPLQLGMGLLVWGLAQLVGAVSLLRAAPHAAPSATGFAFAEHLGAIREVISQHPAAQELWDQIRGWTLLPLVAGLIVLSGTFPLGDWQRRLLGGTSPGAQLWWRAVTTKLPLLLLMRMSVSIQDPFLTVWPAAWSLLGLWSVVALCWTQRLSRDERGVVPLEWSAHWLLLVVALGATRTPLELTLSVLLFGAAEVLWMVGQASGISAVTRLAALTLSGIPVAAGWGSMWSIAAQWPATGTPLDDLGWLALSVAWIAAIAWIWKQLDQFQNSDSENRAIRRDNVLSTAWVITWLSLIGLSAWSLYSAWTTGDTTSAELPLPEPAMAPSAHTRLFPVVPLPWVAVVVASILLLCGGLSRPVTTRERLTLLLSALALAISGFATTAAGQVVCGGMLLAIRWFSTPLELTQRRNGTVDIHALIVMLWGFLLLQPDFPLPDTPFRNSAALVCVVMSVGWLMRWLPVPLTMATDRWVETLVQNITPRLAGGVLLFQLLSKHVESDHHFSLLLPLFVGPLFLGAIRAGALTSAHHRAGLLTLVPVTGLVLASRLAVWDRLHPTYSLAAASPLWTGNELPGVILITSALAVILLSLGEYKPRWSIGFSLGGMVLLGGLPWLLPFLAAQSIPHQRSTLTQLFEVNPISYVWTGGLAVGCVLLFSSGVSRRTVDLSADSDHSAGVS